MNISSFMNLQQHNLVPSYLDITVNDILYQKGYNIIDEIEKIANSHVFILVELLPITVIRCKENQLFVKTLTGSTWMSLAFLFYGQIYSSIRQIKRCFVCCFCNKKINIIYFAQNLFI